MNNSVQSIIQRMLLNLMNDCGNDRAVISLEGKGFKGSSSFSIKIIQVVKIDDKVDTLTSNRSARSFKNRPTCVTNSQSLFEQIVFFYTELSNRNILTTGKQMKH